MSNLTERFKRDYSKKKEKIKKIIDFKKNYKYAFSDDNRLRVLNRDNDKVVLEGRYETIGIYDRYSSIWHWAWNMPFINKDEYDEESVKNRYDEIKLEKHVDDFEYEKYLFYLSKDYFYATKDNIKEITAMMLHFKGEWIFEIPTNDINKVKYVMLDNILKI